MTSLVLLIHGLVSAGDAPKQAPPVAAPKQAPAPKADFAPPGFPPAADGFEWRADARSPSGWGLFQTAPTAKGQAWKGDPTAPPAAPPAKIPPQAPPVLSPRTGPAGEKVLYTESGRAYYYRCTGTGCVRVFIN